MYLADFFFSLKQGVLWALAVIYKVNEKDEELFSKLIQTNFYSNNQSIELAVYGLISLALTIVNVICIILVGVLTLKVCFIFHFLVYFRFSNSLV